MLEPWRSHYLQALGVDIYVSRLRLPGAREPHEPLWDPAALAPPPELTAATTAPPATVAAPAPRPREAAPRPELGVELELPRAGAKPAPAPRAKPAEQPAAATSGIRFALTVVQADSGVVVLDDAPASGARAEYQKLMANLLFALQGRPTGLALDVFQWPPSVKVPQLDQSEDAARETLSAYLQKRLQEGGLLLLLGESAGRWVPDALRQQLIQPPLRCGVSAISAWACLREPAAKRQLWQDLRALVAAR